MFCFSYIIKVSFEEIISLVMKIIHLQSTRLFPVDKTFSFSLFREVIFLPVDRAVRHLTGSR